MLVSRRMAAWAAVLSAAALASAGDAYAVCEEQAGAPVVLRPVQDTRIMQAHPNANDGAAGLVWVKRSTNVRGLVDFDLSCQADATADLACVGLEVSIYEGSPRLDGSNFRAHRMLVPWIEGNQAFNEFSYGGEKLGSFPGSGTGTTWDCRVDPDLTNDTSDNCAPSDKWSGGNNCPGGVPCFAPAFSTARYLDPDQTTLAWDVTSDAIGADGDTSWLIKVEDETVKSGAVKFFTKEGAAFMAENESLPGGAAHFDQAPRLLLWGPNVHAPSATLIAPLGDSAVSPAEVRIRQQGATMGNTARWANLSTGDWGVMSPGGGTDWIASVPLAAGANEVEFTFYDACGTEGRFRTSLQHGATVDQCSDANAADCQGPLLCYNARSSTRKDRLDPVQDLLLSDAVWTSRVDVRKLSGICSPADIEGDGVTAPQRFGAFYRARTSAGEPPLVLQDGIVVTDRFGTHTLGISRVDGLIAPATLGLGLDPLPLGGADDPYRCYRVVSSASSAFPRRLEVRVADRFEDRLYRVRRPRRLCHSTGQVAGVKPMLCYQVQRAVGEPRHQRIRDLLRITDVFGSRGLDTRGEEELCVLADIGG